MNWISSRCSNEDEFNEQLCIYCMYKALEMKKYFNPCLTDIVSILAHPIVIQEEPNFSKILLKLNSVSGT